MSRTSTALKRFGVAGLAVVTIGAGVPALLATAANAAHVTAVTLTPDTQTSPVGTCAQYTVQVTTATPGDTAIVDINADPRAANQDVGFCSVNTAGTTSTPIAGGNAFPGLAGSGFTEHIEITTDNTGKATFGVQSFNNNATTNDGTGVVDITAWVDETTDDDVFQPATEKGDTSVQTFTAGGAGAVTRVDAEPETATAVQGGAYTFTAQVFNSTNQPVAGVIPTFDVTAGPDAAAVGPTNCGSTDQTGTASCTFTSTGGPGEDTVLVYVDNVTAAPTTTPDAFDTGEPSDEIKVTFQAPQAAGTDVQITCADRRTNAAGDQCQNTLTETTEVFTATVKSSTGTPLSGVVVNFSTPVKTGVVDDAGTTTAPDDETRSPASCLTDANGQCSTTVTNPRPTQGEVLSITATIGTAGNNTDSDVASVTFRSPGGAEARNIDLSPATATARIGDVVQLTATVTDRLGGPVQFVEVRFTESGTGRFTNGGDTFTALTDATGKARAELTTTSAEAPGTDTVTATITGYATNANYAGYTTRGAGTADDECEQVAGTTLAPNATPGANNVPGTSAGTCTDTSTITYTATGSPSPSPTGTGNPTTRSNLTLEVLDPLIPAGATARLRATGAASQLYELRCFTRPSTTYVTARSGSFDAAGNAVTFTLSLGRNTRCFIQYATNSTQGASASVVINVRTVLSFTARQTGPRTFVFEGRNLPRVAGQLITLYRIDGAGNEIRTSNLITDSTGIFRLTRTFTGFGTFEFVVRTSTTLNNAAGVSRRQTVNIPR